MTAARLTLALLLATVAIAATACGGGSDSVPSDAVAVVDGTEISKADLDELMGFSKSGYKQSNQAFPKAGTPEYQSIQTRNVAYLVELAQFRKAADDLGLTVSRQGRRQDRESDDQGKFGGKRSEYEKALKKAGFTPEQYRQLALEVTALSTKIFEAVTKDVKCRIRRSSSTTPTNQSQYGSPESRDVRHILIAEKNKDGSVDFEASKAKADEVYAQLKGGADFAALAKQISADPGSKDSGGKLTISRGQTVPRVRQGLVRPQDRRALEAGEDDVRLPRDRGRLRRSEGDHDAHRQGQSVDPHHASAGEAQPGDAEVGRGPEGRLQGQGQLRGRL